MEQLIQNLKDGKMSLENVPFPVLNQGCILVRNHFSVISTGTEGRTVEDARKGLLGKAMARKDEVRKVIRTARTSGMMQTYRMVMNKLEAPAPLGYSCAGEVIEVAPDITDIKAGDLVACGGNTANHAEVIAVPRHLCVKLPENVKPDVACMTTLGSIALQGIRQAELKLGESCVVIGLGLIGQLTLQLLEASGVAAVGIDIDPVQVKRANDNGLQAIQRENEFLIPVVDNLTHGYGADAVILTAGTSSLDPIDLAGELCRPKGKVIIVGAVPTGFKRNNYFRKELDVRMSCSYGPGRYDRDYEIKGNDYPIGYVRWTENRNMQAFVQLISAGKIDPSKLITHSFHFNNSPEAYELITSKQVHYLGITLSYDIDKIPERYITFSKNAVEDNQSAIPVAGIIGAGSFAKNMLLPYLKDQVNLAAIYTSKPTDALHVAQKFRIGKGTGKAEDIFEDKNINTVFITTRHDSHFGFVMEGLKSGKHVFVEKPLCIDESQLESIRTQYLVSGTKLMTGFNRRFAPCIESLKSVLNQNQGLPVSINYRINAGAVPGSHWVHDIETGGGRIVGEVCHFIDLCGYLANSPFASVSAVDLKDTNLLADTVAINLTFKNGSIANISYFSNGNPDVKKEVLEVFFNNQVAAIDDFSSLKITGKNNISNKLKSQDKGHKSAFNAFINSIQSGAGVPISFEEQYRSMEATFKAIESVRLNGQRIFLGASEGSD